MVQSVPHGPSWSGWADPTTASLLQQRPLARKSGCQGHGKRKCQPKVDIKLIVFLLLGYVIRTPSFNMLLIKCTYCTVILMAISCSYGTYCTTPRYTMYRMYRYMYELFSNHRRLYIAKQFLYDEFHVGVQYEYIIPTVYVVSIMAYSLY